MRFMIPIGMALVLTLGSPASGGDHEGATSLARGRAHAKAKKTVGTGCADSEARALASAAKSAVSRAILGKRGIVGVGVASCDRDQVKKLLGIPTPKYVVEPMPLCGVKLDFVDEGTRLQFVRDLWAGRVIADKTREGAIVGSRGDVPVCTEVVGTIRASAE